MLKTLDRAREVVKWFDEKLNSQLNTYGRFWTNMLDSTLH